MFCGRPLGREGPLREVDQVGCPCQLADHRVSERDVVVAATCNKRVGGSENGEELPAEEGARGEVPHEDFELVARSIASPCELQQSETEPPHGAYRDAEDGFGG